MVLPVSPFNYSFTSFWQPPHSHVLALTKLLVVPKELCAVLIVRFLSGNLDHRTQVYKTRGFKFAHVSNVPVINLLSNRDNSPQECAQTWNLVAGKKMDGGRDGGRSWIWVLLLQPLTPVGKAQEVKPVSLHHLKGFGLYHSGWMIMGILPVRHSLPSFCQGGHKCQHYPALPRGTASNLTIDFEALFKKH